MIHRLTGGRWGERLMPLLVPLARCTLLLAVCCSLPVLIAASCAVALDTARIGELTPSVAALYLNAPSFVVASLVGLVGWSVLALVRAASAAPACSPASA